MNEPADKVKIKMIAKYYVHHAVGRKVTAAAREHSEISINRYHYIYLQYNRSIICKK